MIRIAITDDDTMYLETLEQYFSQFFTANSIEYKTSVFTDGRSLIEDCNKQTYDILVLDIDMPELNGIEVAEQIRKQNSNIVLVFVTNMEHLVFESFKYAPYRFIRKSKLRQEIPELLESLRSKFSSESMLYKFEYDDKTIKIPLHEIMYFESFNHDIFLHDCYGNEYKVNETLSTLFEKYEDCGFIKTHKSYLVNYLYIYEFRRNCVVLDNQVELPLSKNRTSEIKQQYTSFTRRELQ